MLNVLFLFEENVQAESVNMHTRELYLKKNKFIDFEIKLLIKVCTLKKNHRKWAKMDVIGRITLSRLVCKVSVNLKIQHVS